MTDLFIGIYSTFGLYVRESVNSAYEQGWFVLYKIYKIKHIYPQLAIIKQQQQKTSEHKKKLV